MPLWFMPYSLSRSNITYTIAPRSFYDYETLVVSRVLLQNGIPQRVFSEIRPTVISDCSCSTGPLVKGINELSCPSCPRRQPATLGRRWRRRHARAGVVIAHGVLHSKSQRHAAPPPPHRFLLQALGLLTGRAARPHLVPAPTSTASHRSSAGVRAWRMMAAAPSAHASMRMPTWWDWARGPGWEAAGSAATGACADRRAGTRRAALWYGCASYATCGRGGGSRRRGPRPRAVCVRVRICGRKSSTSACFSSGKKTQGIDARVEWSREIVDSCYEQADATRARANDRWSYLGEASSHNLRNLATLGIFRSRSTDH
jgi:hypothetical protein